MEASRIALDFIITENYDFYNHSPCLIFEFENSHRLDFPNLSYILT